MGLVVYVYVVPCKSCVRARAAAGRESCPRPAPHVGAALASPHFFSSFGVRCPSLVRPRVLCVDCGRERPRVRLRRILYPSPPPPATGLRKALMCDGCVRPLLHMS